MDVIVPLLARVFPLELAGAIFCALALLSTAPAVSLLHYALHGKLSLWPLVSVLFAYNFVFYMGWLNYLLGVNLALIFAALWLKLRGWPIRKSIPLFAALSTILYFTHLYALGVYGLIVLGLEISHYSKPLSAKRYNASCRTAPDCEPARARTAFLDQRLPQGHLCCSNVHERRQSIDSK